MGLLQMGLLPNMELLLRTVKLVRQRTVKPLRLRTRQETVWPASLKASLEPT